MNTQMKIVDSRGTTYLQSFPVIPPLYKLGKAAVLLTLVVSSVIISLWASGNLVSTNTLFIASAYSCFYLFIAGSLASITSRRPPHKIYSLGVAVFCIVTLLFFATTLLAVFGVVTNNSVIEFFRSGYFSPGPLLLMTVFLVMKVPLLIEIYTKFFKRLALEIEDGFSK